MHYVYILQSQKDSNYYVGSTEHLQRRLNEHNKGGEKFTTAKRPYAITWYCVFKNKKRAADFEKYFKQGPGFAFARKRFV